MPGAPRTAAEPPPGTREVRRRGASLAGALALFALVDFVHFAPVLRADPRSHVASLRVEGSFAALIGSDHRIVAWQVFRNARALVRSPWRFFDAEHCFPTPRSLALGDPMLTMGVLAVPAFLLGAEPVLAYNAVCLALPIVAALAMFLLVREWTGSAPAATVAGLLSGFHPARLYDPVHPYGYDTAWGVLALLFLGRWLRSGRWRDALALAASVSLQIGASFYPLVSAALVLGPVAVWQLVREGLGRARPAQLAVVAGLVAAFAAWLFVPYLELRAAGVLTPRSYQRFAEPAWYLPGGSLFPGVACSLLALAAFAVPARSRFAARSDPRFALALGGLLAVLVAGGPGWRVLAALLPGFDTVRAAEGVSRGLHLAASALAGIGCAGVLAAVPRRVARAAGVLLPLAVSAEVLMAGALGPTPARRFTVQRIAPEAEDLRFFAALARAGNAGPIFEAPLLRLGGQVASPDTAPWLLISAYHGRQTSVCGASHLPDTRLIEALAEQLPRPEAVRGLGALGFSTVVYHHELAGSPVATSAPAVRLRLAWIARDLRAFAAEAERDGGSLRLLLHGRRMSAWGIEPASSP